MVAVSCASPSTLSSSSNAFQNGKNWKALESIWTITGQLLDKSCDLLSSRTAGHCAMIYSNGTSFYDLESAKAEKSFKIYYKILPKSFLIIILIDFELNFVGFLPDRAPLKQRLCLISPCTHPLHRSSGRVYHAYPRCNAPGCGRWGRDGADPAAASGARPSASPCACP